MIGVRSDFKNVLKLLADSGNTPLCKATVCPLHGYGDGGNRVWKALSNFLTEHFCVSQHNFSLKPRPEFSLCNFLESTAWSQIEVMALITLNVVICNDFQLLTKAKHHTVAP